MLHKNGRIFAAIGALALMAAACTSDPEKDSSPTTAGGGDGTEQLEGSTKGLTDDTIKIGFVGADFGALAEAGLVPDFGAQDKTTKAIVDRINADGGLAGRQIELKIEIVDALAGPEAAQAACLSLTQEFGAFAVVFAPAIGRDTLRCTSVTNETLTFAATGMDDSVYEEAEGRLFSLGSQTSMGTYRADKAWAQALDDAGALEGKTIGVVTSAGSPEFETAANEALIPKLEELGYEVAENVSLPCPTGDNDCDQHEPAAQRLKDAGVDLVFMAAANLAGPAFVQAAINIDYHPEYVANSNQVTDTVAGFFDGVKDEWDGTVGVSTGFAAPDDVSDEATECNEWAEPSGESYEPGSDAFGFTALNCIMFRILGQGLDAVKGEANQATVIRALESLGEIPTNAGPPGVLSADRHDAGDFVFLADYSAAEGRFIPRDDEPIKVDD